MKAIPHCVGSGSGANEPSAWLRLLPEASPLDELGTLSLRASLAGLAQDCSPFDEAALLEAYCEPARPGEPRGIGRPGG